RGVVEVHLGRVAAVPLVAFDRAREPPARFGGRCEERSAELTVGAPEGDPLEALAVVAGGDAADMAVADDARLEQPHRAGGDARARPARAVRSRGIQRVAQRARDSAR